MRCGKGHDHESLDQVKACYGVKPKNVLYANSTDHPLAADRYHETVMASFLDADDRSFDAEIQRREREETERVAKFKMARDAKLNILRNPHPVPMGTYTVVKPDGTYRTLQVAPAAWANGATVISYLSGPDNELSYTSCAFLKDDGRFNLFKRFHADSELVRDINTLVTCEVGEAHELFLDQAEAYALKSGRCMRCAHKLTVPASLHRGLGPVCANIEGVK